MEREVGEVAFVTEGSPSSQCGSGCQSGWTLYLDHSDGHRRAPCREPAARRWAVPGAEPTDDGEEEDSMVSDASSGPPLRLSREEEEVPRAREQQHRRFAGGHGCYSSSSGHHSASGSGSGSGFFGSTRSHSALGDATARRVVVVRGAGQYRDADGEDDLDDTASSSAVSCCPIAMVYVADPASREHELCNAMLDRV